MSAVFISGASIYDYGVVWNRMPFGLQTNFMVQPFTDRYESIFRFFILLRVERFGLKPERVSIFYWKGPFVKYVRGFIETPDKPFLIFTRFSALCYIRKENEDETRT